MKLSYGVNGPGKVYFTFSAENGEVLLRSEYYASFLSARSGIRFARESALNRKNYSVISSSDGRYYFNLNASNGLVIATSQMYKKAESAELAIKKIINSLRVDGLKTTEEGHSSKVQLIGSVRTFLSRIESITSDAAVSFYYRGQSDSSYEPVPSVYRNKNWIANEDVMLRELIMRCPEEFENSESTFQALVKMQHYSLPTRLLDVTTNPLIALYFACAGDSSGQNGEVLVFKIPKKEIKYYDSDQVSILSNLAKCSYEFKSPKNSESSDANAEYLSKLISEIRSEKPYFLPKIKVEHLNSVVCVRPKLNNPRVIKQDGAFLLFGIDGVKDKSAKIPEEYMLGGGLLIKSDDKVKILQQLEVLGISHGTIFPEIESVASHIKGIYKVSDAG